MNYKDYQNVRDAVWSILIDLKINSLPVKVTEVCKRLGVAVFSYEKGMPLIQDAGLQAHMQHTDGFTNNQNGPTIFYNGRLFPKRCRFTIAHELGHIVLGHVKPGKVTVLNREPTKNDNPKETEANVFAARLLAPACVLWGLNIHNAEEIATLCHISKQSATFRKERMDLLYKREEKFLRERGKSCFLLSAKERKVYEQFLPFIKSYKSD